jgi:polysaccharide biosynthesis/export protein
MRLLALVAALTLGTMPLVAQQGQVVTSGQTSYSLRPGDIIRIQVWGRDEYSGQFQVDENGELQYPVIGTIQARDLTLGALRDTLRAGLERLFTNPFVTITPLFRIAVLGEVQNPGLFTVDPTLSVMDVVALAGGAARNGNLGKIRLLRTGAESQLSFEQEALAGHTLHDVGIRSGDEIIVPRKWFTRDDLGLVVQFAQLALTVAVFVVTVRQQ